MQPLQEKEQQSNTLVESHVKINTLQEIEMLGNSSVSSQMESTCINFGDSLQDSSKVCVKKNSKDILEVSACETNYYSEPLFQTSVCWSVCVELRKSTNPMHICSLCKLPLSQICPCNKEDPNSDNPMHRVHIRKEFCDVKISFPCNECGKIAKSKESLQCHMNVHHPMFRCFEDNCEAVFNDMELFNIHNAGHLKRLPTRKRKNIDCHLPAKLSREMDETRDVDAMDDSFRDKPYDPSKEVLEEEDEELDHQC